VGMIKDVSRSMGEGLTKAICCGPGTGPSTDTLLTTVSPTRRWANVAPA
jgi:hypothetical protein